MPVIDHDALQNWFTYHSPTPEQIPCYEAIRNAARAFCEVLVANAPQSADLTVAVRHVRDAVMNANAAIACGGK